jgi:hypothetical protein
MMTDDNEQPTPNTIAPCESIAERNARLDAIARDVLGKKPEQAASDRSTPAYDPYALLPKPRIVGLLGGILPGLGL